jgi:hypothetical protein
MYSKVFQVVSSFWFHNQKFAHIPYLFQVSSKNRLFYSHNNF